MAGRCQERNGTVAADISVAVIRDRAKRSCTARRREVVNNCAAGENFAGGRPAPARSQSQSPNPKRVIGRPLAEPEALAPTSYRKRPQEGHYISTILDSFCDRDQSRSGGRATRGSWHAGLSAQSEERASLPGTQSPQRGQRRSIGCLEFCRRLAGGWPRLESTAARGATDQSTAATLSG